MNAKYALSLCCLLLPVSSMAEETYCPGNHGLINVGMTVDQVISACGQPTARQQSDRPLMQRIPVTQLIYSTLNQGAVYQGWTTIYNMWSIGSGSTGTNLQVNLIDNKVSSVSLNGANVNTATVCGGQSIQEGDDVNKVYSVCGGPSLVNNTYVNKPIVSKNKPEVWIYQADQYSPIIRLTFLNGKLQSID